MGAGASQYGERTSLIRGLGASIRDFSRPTSQMIVESWEKHDITKSGYLRREQVYEVLKDLIDVQIKRATDKANEVKQDMAKQQAQMEKMARLQRQEVMNAGDGVSKDQLDRAVALLMGSGTGPVMAGMMAGYMDIPVTCLEAMKKDEDFLNLRLNLMFKMHGNSQGKISLEDFSAHYTGFFDNAPRVLGDGTAGSGVYAQSQNTYVNQQPNVAGGPTGQQSGDCSVQ